jgi:hypothetical protein
LKPLIWRRLLVEDSISFYKLHEIIQIVMGWEDYHMYKFMVNRVCIEAERKRPFCVGSVFAHFRPDMNSTKFADKTNLSDFIKKEKQKFTYLYDFGDNWKHSVVVEKILEKDASQKYPVCTAGKRACPPEDCGGTGGYDELLEIRMDRNHPLYKERIVEWLGGDFDPDVFDIEKVNRRLESNHSLFRSKPGKLDSGVSKSDRKLGRNEPCHCGSGKKYKKCCLNKDLEETGRSKRI